MHLSLRIVRLDRDHHRQIAPGTPTWWTVSWSPGRIRPRSGSGPGRYCD